MDRRRLLQLAGAVSATACLPSRGQSQVRVGGASTPFAYGVASGAPTHDGVVLWTRLSKEAVALRGGEAVEVRWELAHDQHFKRIVQHGYTSATPELGHSVHVEVQGLEPDRWYHYRFMFSDAVSATGRTRTFPLPGAIAKRLRLGYASCQKWEDGYFTAWRHMAAENLDAVMFLGDYIYEYPGTSSKFRVPGGGWLTTLDNYRARYALYKGDPDLQAMHAACPWLVTWDDHEVQNDYAGVQPGDSGPPGFAAADFSMRRAAAYQAYYENMPLRASVLTQGLAGLARGAEMRIYSRVAFGRLASLYLLDGRQYRDAQACNRGDKQGSSMVDPARCGPWRDPGRSYLGLAQEGWLQGQFEGLAARSSVWNVLGQQTLFGQRNFGRNPAQRLWNDGWDGYSAARRRLTDSLQTYEVRNPVIFGGDVHENWVGHVKADYANPDSANVGVEFCGTSISSRSGKASQSQEMLAANPHFVFVDGKSRGYGVADFTPGVLNVQLRVLGDVAQADSGVQDLASFVVEAGSSLIKRA